MRKKHTHTHTHTHSLENAWFVVVFLRGMGTKEGERVGRTETKNLPTPTLQPAGWPIGLVDTRSNSGMISNSRATLAIDAYSLFFFFARVYAGNKEKSGKRKALRGVRACECVLFFCCQLVMIMQRMKRGRRPSKQDRRIDSKETRETRTGMGRGRGKREGDVM